MSLIFSVFNKIFYEYLLENQIINSSSYNGTRFFIIMLIGIVISILFSKLYTSKKDVKETMLEIIINDNKYVLTGLCDSGNLITEPLSGKSVILVCKNTKLGEEIEKTDELKKRYIPYNALDSSGILKGIIPKIVKVNENEIDAIIAPIDKNDFAGYEALVPTALL